MKDSAHTVVYAVTLGVVCAALLTGVGKYTEPRRLANEEAERVLNILRVLDVPLPPDASASALVQAYQDKVEKKSLGELEVYEYREPDSPDAVLAIAIPFEGKGVWGPIKGFLALEPDRRTIRDIAFYEQEETPGLGGEIVSEKFRSGFRDGKTIVSPSGEPGMRIVRPGRSAASNDVDGISGATGTCQKLEKMLNAVIARLTEKRKRHGQ